MAVIRAKRLWAVSLPPGLASTKPGELMPPERSVVQKVYTCPAGKRAIVRCITASLTSVPPAGNEPTYQVVIYNATTGWCLVHYFWFVDHSAQIAVWILSDTWNGQLVLHGGDYVEIRSQSSVNLDCHGSGHELPELAGASL